MSGKPAANLMSMVQHPLPPKLNGAGCFTVLINNQPSWRGLPTGGGAGGGGGGGGFDAGAIQASSQGMLQEKEQARIDAENRLQQNGSSDPEAMQAYDEALKAEQAASEMVGGIMDSLSSGIGAGLVSILQGAKQASDAVLKSLEAAKNAASGTPAYPAAEAAEKAGQLMAATMMGTMITGMAATPMGMADIHICSQPLPLPPHGPGLVIDGSSTVMICGMPAAKVGCTIVEAVGPPNKITQGSMNVMIGG